MAAGTAVETAQNCCSLSPCKSRPLHLADVATQVAAQQQGPVCPVPVQSSASLLPATCSCRVTTEMLIKLACLPQDGNGFQPYLAPSQHKHMGVPAAPSYWHPPGQPSPAPACNDPFPAALQAVPGGRWTQAQGQLRSATAMHRHALNNCLTMALSAGLPEIHNAFTLSPGVLN